MGPKQPDRPEATAATAAAGGPPSPQRDTDGVLRGQAVLDGLVQLLDLEPIGADAFRGHSPPSSGRSRVFGGQVASQALVAAARTVSSERRVHSLHAYFLRPGDPRVPLVYRVDRLRDGGSFTTRRTLATQNDVTIFAMSASFQIDEPGLDHGAPAPRVPSPEELPTLAQRIAGIPDELASWRRQPRAFDIRYVNDPPWQARSGGPQPQARSQVWYRADGVLPDDPVLHVCMLAYMSDVTLLDSLLVTHGIAPGVDNIQMASLDHAMWFHRPIRVDDWVLYDTASPSASGARGLAIGHFYDEHGAMLATAVQEGLIRLR
jgi:acyl-CoA thioesterase II